MLDISNCRVLTVALFCVDSICDTCNQKMWFSLWTAAEWNLRRNAEATDVLVSANRRESVILRLNAEAKVGMTSTNRRRRADPRRPWAFWPPHSVVNRWSGSWNGVAVLNS